ncbi:hypothetical protein GCM10020001_035010 [Nonomuraea salmonea]
MLKAGHWHSLGWLPWHPKPDGRALRVNQEMQAWLALHWILKRDATVKVLFEATGTQVAIV